MNNLVTVKNNQVVVSSRQVAENFGKQHRHVLDSIKEIVGVAEFSADLFRAAIYTHPQNKQRYPEYLMNRDGFTLLAMGFTGEKALQWKLKYIQAFNEMEEQLKNPQTYQLIRKTYKGEPVMTTLDIANLIGIAQGSVGYNIKKFNLPFRFLEGAALKDYKRENRISDSSAADLIILDKPAVIKLLQHLKTYTHAIRFKIDEYFALVPLAKPMNIVEVPKLIEQPKQVLYADIPNNKKICEQIERVKSFMDALDLLLFQYNRHIKQEHADAYRKVISLVGSELYNEVLDLSIMKYQLVEKPGY
mgnify:CR=1 FL=1